MNRETAFTLLKMAVAVAGVGTLVMLMGGHLGVGSTWAPDRPLLAGGAVAVMFSGLPLALRMGRTLAVWGIRLPARTAVRVSFQSVFYLFFAPMSLGMEVARFAKIRMALPAVSRRRLAAALLSDRALGFAALCLLATASLPWSRVAGAHPEPWGRWAAAATVVAAVGATGGWSLWRNELFGRLPGVRHAVRGHAGTLASALLLSLTVTLVLSGGIALGARALGLAPRYLDVVFVVSASTLAQLVPLSLLGVTLTEAAAMALWMALGLDRGQAATMVFLSYSARLLLASLGGLWELVHGGLALTRAAGVEPVAESARSPPRSGEMVNREGKGRSRLEFSSRGPVPPPRWGDTPHGHREAAPGDPRGGALPWRRIAAAVSTGAGEACPRPAREGAPTGRGKQHTPDRFLGYRLRRAPRRGQGHHRNAVAATTALAAAHPPGIGGPAPPRHARCFRRDPAATAQRFAAAPEPTAPSRETP